MFIFLRVFTMPNCEKKIQKLQLTCVLYFKVLQQQQQQQKLQQTASSRI